MAVVARFNLNRNGRDFVCGDIHGAYDLVIAAMRRANFDRSVDRLFCVGDLIDRGHGSARCVRFLQQPYVHAVRGNHEQMLIDLYQDGDPPEGVLQFMVTHNGFGWWMSTPGEVRQQVLEAVRQLPIAIEVTTTRGRVGLVHADVPRGMPWQVFIERLERGDAQVLETALEGRERIKQQRDDGIQGIDRVFVGHTIQWCGLQRLGNVYAIDTGGVFAELCPDRMPGARLTMATMAMATQALVAPAGEVAEGVEVREGWVPDTPFGPYSL
jgi:serine/threonine protein phosphatase 1